MFALAKPLCRLFLVPAVVLCLMGLPGVDTFSGPTAAHADGGTKKGTGAVAKKGKKKGKKGKKKNKKAKKAAAQA